MTILLTDTGSVFGHALAMEYLNTGSQVYGISKRHNDQLEKYVNYNHLKHDVQKIDNLDKKLKDFLGHVKIFDLVVLNADTFPVKQEIRNTTVNQIIDAMNINVLANKIIINALLDSTSEIYQVVAISTEVLVSSARGWNAYAISKSALNTLMRLYAREIPQTHFSAIDPGMTDDTTTGESFIPGNNKKYKVSGKIRGVQNKGNIPDPIYAANYMVEAMGIVLQEKSGSYKDVREMLFSTELSH
ncbi:MAG: SDR family NAD(P)-dependent oxidoreductase [Bacteroidales bacterium]